MWTQGMFKAASNPNFANPTLSLSINSSGGDDQIGELGELHIRRRMTEVKERQRKSRTKLEDIMKASRDLGESSSMSRAGVHWLGMNKQAKAVTIDSQPKYMGQQANELSKWTNAESITRFKEEMNVAVPTLRQVLKCDDGVSMRQMTKSQLAALPFDPTDSKRAPRIDPEATQRPKISYRPVMKS
mmetsp:Transcript_49416/g.152436  ORF Transcript_49416/g.152436 Transcript_49416/m.152436 type:complete len:186 (-) Transcript_49416:231-788(-)